MKKVNQPVPEGQADADDLVNIVVVSAEACVQSLEGGFRDVELAAITSAAVATKAQSFRSVSIAQEEQDLRMLLLPIADATVQ